MAINMAIKNQRIKPLLVARLLTLAVLFILPGCAMSDQKAAEPWALQTKEAAQPTPSQVADQGASRPINWQTRFTFEGQARPGPYTVDPHIWVYTKEFAERFGMPEEWISDELKGVDAAAWRKTKTGHITCGWGGKKDACREETTGILEVYIDTNKVKLPWGTWAIERKQLDGYYPLVISRMFLTPSSKDCLEEKTKLKALRSSVPEPCGFGVGLQPFADPLTGQDIFFYKKKAGDPNQGGFTRVYAYDKSLYPGMAWLQFGYQRIFSSYPEMAVAFRLETRNEPMGQTIRAFHEFILPKQFDRRIKEVLDADREAEREFYKKSLNMK